ncbi:MAG: UbiA family prenyltransferase [Candidatus Bathyarchaeota archaeon]|nr:MAG: UbiA family prenyltransferase [Candidatus Bathyarchaeota archaeon]
MRKLGAFLRLIRPVNCLMMGFAVVVGASLVTYSNFLINLLLAIVTSFTLTAASMAINDYYDREIDEINEPQRPIPSGAVSPREALLLAFVLSIIGFIAAFGTNVQCLATAVVAWIVSVTYVTKGKRSGLPGNLLVSTCVVIPFIYGGFAVARPELTTITFVAIAFLSNTGREVAKNIVDVEGDKSQDIRTIPVVYGERVAAFVSSLFFILAIALSPLPWLLELVSPWFLPLVILTDVGLAWSSFSIVRDHSRNNARRVKNSVLIWFLTGLLGFVAGSVS